jgi:DNA mismatch repair ATPase MutS
MIDREIREFYNSERLKYSDLFKAEQKILGYLSALRLILFFGGLGAAIMLFRVSNLIGTLSIVVVIALFFWVLKVFTHRTWLRDYYLNLINVNENELRGLDGDYSNFNNGLKYVDPAHDFSHDIDVFGNNSLFQYLDRTCSDLGSDILADWLKRPFLLAPDFDQRSEAIHELSGLAKWRQRFIGLSKMNKSADEDRIRLYEWLNEKPLFKNERLVKSFTIILPSLTLTMLALSIAGVLSYTPFILLFLVNLTLISFNLKKINAVHSMVSRQYSSLLTIKSLIEHFNETEFKSPLLNRFKDELGGKNIKALNSIAGLSKIIQVFDSRLNMIVGAVLNGVLLMDYISVLRLENWKREVKEFIPDWFDNLGSIDALSSLANYAFNNPYFCYPRISENEKIMDAIGLGHPLIIVDKRVVNDFYISRRGEITIITGANMAGKSTFLRTVAVNFIMAMIGAPVCAKEFTFIPSGLFTSMRTSDSLSDSESYFYAELKRLRHLKERLVENEPLLFILDEILKGTNSKDKSEGSLLFIEKIIKLGATGIVATHDIILGDLEREYPENIKNSCFEITIEGDKISFDYLLREGVTTRMNAAILMKQHGIID